ncbi:MAG: acetate--CoA ligase family protein [Candidatus Nitrosopolaris sp.]
MQITRNVKQYNPNPEINGILVQEIVAGGKETIIGSKQEPGFGAVVMFGMGGIYFQLSPESLLWLYLPCSMLGGVWL